MIDLACNWFSPRVLYGNLLLRQMGQGFFPSQELQHFLLLSISAFIILVGTQCVLSMILCLPQFSLESLTHFFLDWSQINLLKDARNSKDLVKQIPRQLMLRCLESNPAFMVNPKFLALPRMRQISKIHLATLEKKRQTKKPQRVLGCKNSSTWLAELSLLLSSLWDFWTLEGGALD